MQTLSPKYSLEIYLEDATFTLAALLAEPHAADLGGRYEAKIGECDALVAQDQAVKREVTKALALVAVGNCRLDEATMATSARLLGQANGDRQSPVFRRVFPEPASELAGMPIREHATIVLERIAPELAKLPEGSPARGMAEEIAGAAKLSLEALEKRSKARAARESQSLTALEWKEGYSRFRRGIHGELLKRAADLGRSKAWAESFFKPIYRNEPEEPAAPAEPNPA